MVKAVSVLHILLLSFFVLVVHFRQCVRFVCCDVNETYAQRNRKGEQSEFILTLAVLTAYVKVANSK